MCISVMSSMPRAMMSLIILIVMLFTKLMFTFLTFSASTSGWMVMRLVWSRARPVLVMVFVMFTVMPVMISRHDPKAGAVHQSHLCSCVVLAYNHHIILWYLKYQLQNIYLIKTYYCVMSNIHQFFPKLFFKNFIWWFTVNYTEANHSSYLWSL